MDSDAFQRRSCCSLRDDSDDSDFAFATLDTESSSQIPADQIFKDGKIRPAYPVSTGDPERPKTRNPLMKLFVEETETSAAAKVRAAAAELEEGRWRKSKSAGGNSNRWKLKNLMSRSQSVGSKGSVVAPRKKEEEKKQAEGGKARAAPASNRDGGEKPRSYLPYRLGLVGFFGNVNGSRKYSK